MENRGKPFRAGKVALIITMVFSAIAILGGIIMALWNAILPDLLHVSEITYWQALGLFILCKLLFGGFRFGGGPGRFGPGRRWKEKFANMSEEEREAFKAKWKERCLGKTKE